MEQTLPARRTRLTGLEAPCTGAAYVPPVVQAVATIQRGASTLQVSALATGARAGVEMQVYRPGPGGAMVPDPRRRLSLRADEIGPVIDALREAGDVAARLLAGEDRS